MIVIDCSIMLAGVLDDEGGTAADNVLYRLSSGELQAIVPRLFFIEAANVIVSNVRRRRITQQQSVHYIELFETAPVETDSEFRMQECKDLAIQYELSIYDAIYLELALRKGALLATLDKKLMSAAKKNGILYG